MFSLFDEVFTKGAIQQITLAWSKESNFSVFGGRRRRGDGSRNRREPPKSTTSYRMTPLCGNVNRVVTVAVPACYFSSRP